MQVSACVMCITLCSELPSQWTVDCHPGWDAPPGPADPSAVHVPWCRLPPPEQDRKCPSHRRSAAGMRPTSPPPPHPLEFPEFRNSRKPSPAMEPLGEVIPNRVPN